MSLQERLTKFRQSVDRLDAYRSVLLTQLALEQTEIEQLRYSAELQQRSSEIFKSWLEDLLKSNVDSIAELATSGLKHVIFDQQLSFKIRQELKYNRLSLHFSLEDESGVEGDPLYSFGGGPISVVSLVLRLAVMTRMQMGNLLLLDESMASLANHYIPAAADFMRQLSEQTGINILMVTHNDEFLNYAHTTYEGNKDTDLRLTRRRSTVKP